MKITAKINKFKNKALRYYSNTKIDVRGLDILYYVTTAYTYKGMSLYINTPTRIESKFSTLEEIANSSNDCLVIVCAAQGGKSDGNYHFRLLLKNEYFRNKGKTIYLILCRPPRSNYDCRIEWTDNPAYSYTIDNEELYKFEYYKPDIVGNAKGLLTRLSNGQTTEIQGL